MNEKETILMMQDIHMRVTDIQNRLYENMTREESQRVDYSQDLMALTELQKEAIIIDNQMEDRNLEKWKELMSHV